MEQIFLNILPESTDSGDIEYSAITKLYKIKLGVLIKAFYGYITLRAFENVGY